MIGYQVPRSLRQESPTFLFQEGITSFLAVGIFAYLVDANKPVSADVLDELTEYEFYDDIDVALRQLDALGFVESIQINARYDLEVQNEIN